MHKEWKELKHDIGEFVCQIDGLYKSCDSIAEIDERAYARGLKDAKKEACKDCLAKKHMLFLQEYEKLPERLQIRVKSLVYDMVAGDDL